MVLRHLGVALLFFACAAPVATTVTTTATTTTPPPATTLTTVAALPHLVASTAIPGGLPIDVYGPVGMTDAPAVVLFHGGGWFGGDPSTMAPLASALAERGMVAFNATYRTGNGGYPESFEDVACAVRFASAEAPTYTTAAPPPLVVGHSAGAQLASVVALAGDAFAGDCPVPGSALPAGFVGLAGPYDVSQFTLVLASYFGTRYEVDPTPWEQGSAFSYLAQNPDLEVLLIHGDADEVVPVDFSRQLADALDESGHAVTLEILPGADHAAARDPALVADLIEEFGKSQ